MVAAAENGTPTGDVQGRGSARTEGGLFTSPAGQGRRKNRGALGVSVSAEAFANARSASQMPVIEAGPRCVD